MFSRVCNTLLRDLLYLLSGKGQHHTKIVMNNVVKTLGGGWENLPDTIIV